MVAVPGSQAPVDTIQAGQSAASTKTTSIAPEAKPKPRPRKLQRGQKKKKVVKSDKLEDAVNNLRDGKAQSEREQTIAAQEAVVNEFDVQSATSILPPKKPGTSRKRKDGYDPSQLAPEVVLPSAERMKEATTSAVKPGSVVARPSAKPGLSKRQAEINQLKRRYGDSIDILQGSDSLVFPFVPSDPDFPYELPELKMKLTIPQDYPKVTCTLSVYSGLEPGFARNIERAFVDEKIGFGFGGRGIMGMLTWLDRNMERLLGMKKSETVKIVRHQAGSGAARNKSPPRPSKPNSQQDAALAVSSYTEQEILEAAVARNMALSKLRMIHPSKLGEESFDLDLNDETRIRLQVPGIFPLQPAWLMVLKGNTEIEDSANQILKENTRGLARTINWLASNLQHLIPKSKVIATQPKEETICRPPETTSTGRVPEHADFDGFVLVANHVYSVPDETDTTRDEEYSSGDDHDGMSDLEEEMNSVSLTHDAKEQPQTRSQRSETTTQTQEKGTAINAALSLTHISLLEPISLSLNLKCLRCKSTGNHIASVQTGKHAEVQCPTCSSLLSVTFRGQALHQANSRIGYLDLIGASVLDLGPGTFSPTCEKCDVVGVAFKGLVAGQPQTRPCRACYIKQTVSITTTSFLVINSSVKAATIGSREAQNLNIQRGKALPNNGVCKHYRKSNRWFRFSCCNKVYACDLCHESLTDHEMELARFQICGWCSKESAIRGLKPCVHCGRDLTRRSRGGFWEGGQGTRDQSKMNKNDPRKYRKRL